MADCENVDEEEEERGGGEAEVAAANERSNLIGLSKAETILTKCSEWLEVQNAAHATQILLPDRIRYLAFQKAFGVLKENKRTDYF
jgi:hypothetical protein